jgi:hypothetical protein
MVFIVILHHVSNCKVVYRNVVVFDTRPISLICDFDSPEQSHLCTESILSSVRFSTCTAFFVSSICSFHLRYI